jgi:hypothetical protein
MSPGNHFGALVSMIGSQKQRNIFLEFVFEQSAATELQGIVKVRKNQFKNRIRGDRESMMNQMKVTVLGAALAVFTLPAIAQNSTPSSSTASTPTTKSTAAPSVQQRDENQQDRISQGVGSGQLTAGEAGNLEKKESQLNQEQRDMRKLDNGHLTAADKATLQQQQNHLSNQIYKDKHNGATQGNQGAKTEVGGRAERQQDRIAQGVASGQLTAGEASHLEKQEGNIHNEIRADRKANGGKLTSAERAQINHQQTQLSHQIRKDKHNGRHQ